MNVAVRLGSAACARSDATAAPRSAAKATPRSVFAPKRMYVLLSLRRTKWQGPCRRSRTMAWSLLWSTGEMRQRMRVRIARAALIGLSLLAVGLVAVVLYPFASALLF